jgi:SAM-dependent methyltransferase
VALMISIGHRTALFDTMAEMGPASSREIANRAGLSERYVREWLGAMVTGGIVIYDAANARYTLPPEHADFLTRRASPNNMASTCQWIAVLGAVEDEVTDAFRHGNGVPYSAYKRFHQVMADESEQTVIAGLMDHIIPLVPGLKAALRDGIDVLDVGCGAGGAIRVLAESFPQSRFTGFDLCDGAIGLGQREAVERHLINVRLAVRDVAGMEETDCYDLITAFDAIHDQARPDLVLANIRRALRPGGTFLMQDIGASSHLHENVGHPIGPFIYTVSCMHCMSVSLANRGMGLGAAWGKQKALEMLEQAGFHDVRVEQLEHDCLNYYYVAEKRSS